VIAPLFALVNAASRSTATSSSGPGGLAGHARRSRRLRGRQAARHRRHGAARHVCHAATATDGRMERRAGPGPTPAWASPSGYSSPRWPVMAHSSRRPSRAASRVGPHDPIRGPLDAPVTVVDLRRLRVPVVRTGRSPLCASCSATSRTSPARGGTGRADVHAHAELAAPASEDDADRAHSGRCTTGC
jgi:hypothetical protein